MCGIAGVFNPHGVGSKILQKISSDLAHRGPDDEGFAGFDRHYNRSLYAGKDSEEDIRNTLPSISQLDKKTILAFAHRRLSILDLSSRGHQPLVDKENRLLLVFNGEIYNFVELRSQLESLGYTFTSGTDTEVIFKAYKAWGISAFEKFIGMWAVAFLDVEKQQIILSRDRYGIKPLYFSLDYGRFAFASEIKPLLNLDFVSTDTAASNITEYIAYGTTSAPYNNLFSDIRDVPPGHHYIFNLRDSSIQQTCYYDPGDYNFDGQFDSFTTLFKNSVRLHLRSDVEVGTCLSGGIDSSALAVAMKKESPGIRLHSFTAVFPGHDVDEGTYARSVANALDLEAHFIEPTAEELLEEMDEMIYMQELPIGSSSIYAQWNVMKCAAQQNMKVLIDGQGADETLGGYHIFAGIYLLELLKRLHWIRFYREYQNLKRNLTDGMTIQLARAGYAYLPAFLKRYFRNRQRKGIGLISEQYHSLLNRAVPPERNGKDFREHSLKSLKYSLYDLLRYEDRNSMAFSIESRVPFLDHRLVEYILRMPWDELIVDGWTKYPLRTYLDNRIPDRVTWRRDKKGFATPQREWKNTLFPKIKQYILDVDLPDVFDRDQLVAFCESDTTHEANLSEFWRIYSLIKWNEQFNVNIR